MIAESTAVDPELTPKVKALLRAAGQRLTGPGRRAFFAQVADTFFGGSARQTESHLGWSRHTTAQGQKEQASGIVCLGDYQARGNHPIEAKWPDLERDMRALADAHAQADPPLRTALAYTRLSAATLRRALIEEKGWSPGEVPAERTLREVLNRLGYRLRAVAKTRPEKKRPSARRSLPT